MPSSRRCGTKTVLLRPARARGPSGCHSAPPPRLTGTAGRLLQVKLLHKALVRAIVQQAAGSVVTGVAKAVRGAVPAALAGDARFAVDSGPPVVVRRL